MAQGGVDRSVERVDEFTSSLFGLRVRRRHRTTWRSKRKDDITTFRAGCVRRRKSATNGLAGGPKDNSCRTARCLIHLAEIIAGEIWALWPRVGRAGRTSRRENKCLTVSGR